MPDRFHRIILNCTVLYCVFLRYDTTIKTLRRQRPPVIFWHNAISDSFVLKIRELFVWFRNKEKDKKPWRHDYLDWISNIESLFLFILRPLSWARVRESEKVRNSARKCQSGVSSRLVSFFLCGVNKLKNWGKRRIKIRKKLFNSSSGSTSFHTLGKNLLSGSENFRRRRKIGNLKQLEEKKLLHRRTYRQKQVRIARWGGLE